MPVIIPDDVLRETGLSAGELAIEIACRLFDAEFLALWPAAQLAGLSRVDFENECARRHISVYRYNAEMVAEELGAIHRMKELRSREADRAGRQ